MVSNCTGPLIIGTFEKRALWPQEAQVSQHLNTLLMCFASDPECESLVYIIELSLLRISQS